MPQISISRITQTKFLRGFTLVELIVVMAILAVLSSITLIAINPAQQFAATNNVKRKSDIASLLNAVNQYQADHHGELPPGIDTRIRTIASNPPNALESDLCSVLVPTYLAALPVDPQNPQPSSIQSCSTPYDTGYTITQSTNERLTLSAPNAELQEIITITR